jgi:hypothetical protein
MSYLFRNAALPPPSAVRLGLTVMLINFLPRLRLDVEE